MKKRFGWFLLFWMAFSTQTARADLGFWSAALRGVWLNPQNGDRYQFRSNATYTFWAGNSKSRSQSVSHSGWWKIAPPTQKESGGSMEGPVALVLRSTARTVSQGGRERILKSTRTFRIVVDTVQSDGERIDKDFYRIGKVKWKRVK